MITYLWSIPSQFNIPFNIIKKTPYVSIRPRQFEHDNKILIFDDLSYSGRAIERAIDYLKNKEGIEDTNIMNLTLVDIIEERNIKNAKINCFYRYFARPEKGFKNGNIKLYNHENIIIPKKRNSTINSEKIKNKLIDSCLVEKRYWSSWNAFEPEIFIKTCEYMNSFIKDLDFDAIVATSTYAFPYASVLSYMLKKPLFIFSRKVTDLSMDLEPSPPEKYNMDFIFIEDQINTGGNTKTAETRIRELGNEKRARYRIIKKITVFSTIKGEDIISLVNVNDIKKRRI